MIISRHLSKAHMMLETEYAVFKAANDKLVMTEYDPALIIDRLREMTEAAFNVLPTCESRLYLTQDREENVVCM